MIRHTRKTLRQRINKLRLSTVGYAHDGKNPLAKSRQMKHRILIKILAAGAVWAVAYGLRPNMPVTDTSISDRMVMSKMTLTKPFSSDEEEETTTTTRD